MLKFQQLKIAPRAPQDGPKTPPRVNVHVRVPAERGPKSAQDGPKSAQDGPRSRQDRPKIAQDGPKIAQDGPKSAQDRFRIAPRSLLASKTSICAES